MGESLGSLDGNSLPQLPAGLSDTTAAMEPSPRLVKKGEHLTSLLLCRYLCCIGSAPRQAGNRRETTGMSTVSTNGGHCCM